MHLDHHFEELVIFDDISDVFVDESDKNMMICVFEDRKGNDRYIMSLGYLDHH